MASENEIIEMKEIQKKKENDGRPISYTQRQRENREQAYIDKYRKGLELFFKYQEFYEEHYPKSTHEIEWAEDKVKLKIPEGEFDKILDKLSELELYHILTVLDYGRKEFYSGDIKEHYSHLLTRGLISTRIPGYPEQEILSNLKNKKAEQEKSIQDLEKKINQKRVEFMKSHGENVEVETKVFICEICGFQAVKGSGLASHMRYKHPDEGGIITKSNIITL